MKKHIKKIKPSLSGPVGIGNGGNCTPSGKPT